MTTDGENRITKADFERNKTVIIADEAHRLNVMTRSSDKVKQDERNWEQVVVDSLNANEDNLLLEFTATVDLRNPKINEKYRNKLVHRYDFLNFNKDGYAKNVRFLYNRETQVEDQKRLLIVNAVALSEYRKLLFQEVGERINPVVLVKSKKIDDCKIDKVFFHKVIDSLSERDFAFLEQIKDEEDNLVVSLFNFLQGRGITLSSFIQSIRVAFAEQHTLEYHSKSKGCQDTLNHLDDDNPRNVVRVVFSVNALNEGWDVLSLFDIVHFDIGENKKVKLQDVQLIGRGARYCPFLLPDEPEINNRFDFDVYENERDKRKFDKTNIDRRKMLETFYYHFVDAGVFREELGKHLVGEGILEEDAKDVSIEMKDVFKL